MPNKPVFDVTVVGDKKKHHPIKISNGPENVWPSEGKTVKVFCNVTVSPGQAVTLAWFKKVLMAILQCMKINFFVFILID